MEDDRLKKHYFPQNLKEILMFSRKTAKEGVLLCAKVAKNVIRKRNATLAPPISTAALVTPLFILDIQRGPGNLPCARFDEVLIAGYFLNILST